MPVDGLRPAGIWAVVPIKSLVDAKKRLADTLDAQQRRALMLAMAHDVLHALSQSRRLAGTLIVSRAPEADTLADAFGAHRFAESPHANLPGALEEAAAHLTRHHQAQGIFIVPADTPLISTQEIDQLLANHRSVTLLPDQEGVGTNGLICSPPDAIELVFDGQSFAPHLQHAQQAGIIPHVVRESRCALDIDTPADLGRLLRSGAETQSGRFLAKLPIAKSLLMG